MKRTKPDRHRAWPLIVCVLILTVARGARAADLALEVLAGRAHDATVKPADSGVVEIRTTGRDVYVHLQPTQPDALDLAARPVLEFEYFSTTGVRPFRVRLDPVPSADHLLAADPLGISEGWSRRTVDLTPLLGEPATRARGLRLDLGNRPDKVLQIRAAHLRPFNEAERRSAADREARLKQDRENDAAIRAYLARTFPCEITRVAADERRITVEGRVAATEGPPFLARVPIEAAITQVDAFEVLQPITAADGHFSTTVDRRADAAGQPHDRLLDRWAVVARTATGIELRSHFHYANDVHAASAPPRPTPRGKKGLGALWPGRPLEDLDDLGISYATVNVNLNALMRTAAGAGRTAFDVAGRTWYIDDRAVAHLDEALLAAAKRHIVVSAILLVGQARGAPDPAWGKLIAHPDADPSGIYVMPNLTSRDGVEAYAAALDFLARRYMKAGGEFGRIHHWILHNEVDAGWVWTNAGERSVATYLDLYHRSMRLADLIGRQYDPDAKPFISLTHFWAKPGERHFYASRELLDLLLGFSRTEGDFDWAIAHHPYPQNLANPRVWEDRQVDYTFDTPLITFKNLEVLDAWVRQPRARFKGRPRTIHLTEQGLNSPDYGEASLRDQAAGMAYAWTKVEALPTIEAFQYHNWVDNRGEGGLRIGLRRFPDDKDDPHGKKPIWHVYRALETPGQAAAIEPYKAVLGVKEWAEVRHPLP
jgi:hypothetical protein